MLISLNWLSDYVNVDLPVEKLGELLTSIGLNLEGVIDAGHDIVLDLEVTSNRPDCLGHLGVARELAAATGKKFALPAVGRLPATGPKADEITSVQVDAPDLCPRYTARVVRNVKVRPSPQWLVDRLKAVGLRSVNNVVDVTNFVLMEYSQPLHGFDYDKLAERRIVVRRARAGERLVSIDQTTCTLDEQMLVIADADRAVAVAGVMGGLDTEVTQATTNVLIESAQFDPVSIRRTSGKLQLSSESNFRFERGVNPVAVDAASLRACELIIELAGGELAEGMVDVWAQPFEPRKVSLRPARCDALLGTQTPPARQMEILAAVGLRPVEAGGAIECTIPPHRADLTREADLIEEVARIEGFDKIPLARSVTHPIIAESLGRRTRRRTGEVLVAAGLDEAITFTFVDDEEAGLFAPGEALNVDTTVRKSNNVLRKTLLNSLLRACKTNQDAGEGEVSLFEIAAVFAPAEDQPAGEHTELGMVTTRSLRFLRGAVEVLAERLCPLSSLSVTPADAPGFAAGSAATISLDDEPVGALGAVDAKVQNFYDLERPIAAAAIDFEKLLARADQQATYQPLPRFPAVTRDLSLIVDDAVTWRQLAEVVAGIDQPMRVATDYVTTFRGKPIAKGRKSVTVTLTYRSPGGTLRSEQVDEQVQAVVAAADQALGAELRSQ